MKVLLAAMPDTVSALDAITRIPNLGLCSIAANLDGCEVKVVDLVFHTRRLKQFLVGTLSDYQPDIVGLSAMSHQYASACKAAGICHEFNPAIKVVLGGYHASLMFREIGEGNDAGLFDFIVRGEGEATFNRLVDKLKSGGLDFGGIPGLSYRDGKEYKHNLDAPLLDLSRLRLPDRDCRMIDKALFMGQKFDCVETSRGCTMNCRFCSIKMMYGRKLRLFPLDRVVTDLNRLKARGVRGVFFVDDNITLDVPRLKDLCRLIVEEKLNTMTYIMQASVQGISSDSELPGMLRQAGFKWVFLGIENGISRNLDSMGKKGVLNNTDKAVSSLQAQGIGVFGGFIVGNPGDTRDDTLATFKYALETKVDHPIIQCLTPYPKTETREELSKLGLITNAHDFSLYNGFTCNVRTEHLSTSELNSAMFWGGLRLYFNGGYLARSRFWRYRFGMIPSLVANNFRYLAGALKGRIFISRHRW